MQRFSQACFGGGGLPFRNRQLPPPRKFYAGRNFLNGSYHTLLLEYKKKRDSHLSQLMLVTHEGPVATLSREQLVNVVYVWYRKKERRIQLPDPVVQSMRDCAVHQGHDVDTVRNRQVLLGDNNSQARWRPCTGFRGPDSGPTPPLPG